MPEFHLAGDHRRSTSSPTPEAHRSSAPTPWPSSSPSQPPPSCRGCAIAPLPSLPRPAPSPASKPPAALQPSSSTRSSHRARTLPHTCPRTTRSTSSGHIPVVPPRSQGLRLLQFVESPIQFAPRPRSGLDLLYSAAQSPNTPRSVTSSRSPLSHVDH
nr:vegetative cell wall protein gp1-like isoform X2 [Aegilops tauschii subsp. strangulata]